MRVTIIPSDKLVRIDADVVWFDYVLDTDIPTVHAVQWNGTTGHIEHIDDNGKMLAVEEIHDIGFAQHVIDEAVLKINEIKEEHAKIMAQKTENSKLGEPTIIR